MKRLVALLLSGVIAACGVSKMGSVRASPEELREKIADSYCIRRTLVIERQGFPALAVSENHGTAWVSGKGPKGTYFVTAGHVVAGELPTPPAGYHISRVYFSLVDNATDSDESDDKRLRLLRTSKEDIAVLLLNEQVQREVTPACTVQPGDYCFTVSYPFAIAPVIDEGIVSTGLIHMMGGEKNILTIDGAHGMSGAPVYSINDGVVCLFGMVVATTKNYNYTLSVPATHAFRLTREAAENPLSLEEKLLLYGGGLKQ